MVRHEPGTLLTFHSAHEVIVATQAGSAPGEVWRAERSDLLQVALGDGVTFHRGSHERQQTHRTRYAVPVHTRFLHSSRLCLHGR